MEQRLPKLRGLVDARVENEIYLAFQNLYNYIDEKIATIPANNKAESIAEIKKQVGLFAAGLAVPIVNPSGTELATVGQETTLTPADIPNLSANKITSGIFPLARVATNILKTDDAFTITPGLVVVGGQITLKDNNGHTVQVLTP